MTQPNAYGAVDRSAATLANASRYRIGVRAALRDGTPVCIRALRSDDKERLRRGFERLSPKSVYQRFFHTVKTLTDGELRQVTELDFCDRVALVLTTRDEDDETFIAVARFARVAPGAERAEVAIVVADAYQHRGAASLLLAHLIDVARAVGVRELLALVLEDNDEMLELLRSCGLPMTRELDHGIRRIVLSL